MSVNPANFPTSVWDGSTPTRNDRRTDRDPDYEDWDQMLAEVIALQNHLTNKTQDNKFPAASIRVPAANNPTWTAYKGSQVLAFSDQAVEGNEEIIYFQAQIAHGRTADSVIVPHVHWVGEDNTAGNVRWKLTYSWANIGDAFPSETTITLDDANLETDIHNYAVFDSIDGTDKTRSSMLLGSLRRNSSHANDTFNSKDAYLLEFDIHERLSGIGD